MITDGQISNDFGGRHIAGKTYQMTVDQIQGVYEQALTDAKQNYASGYAQAIEDAAKVLLKVLKSNLDTQRNPKYVVEECIEKVRALQPKEQK